MMFRVVRVSQVCNFEWSGMDLRSWYHPGQGAAWKRLAPVPLKKAPRRIAQLS
ncbi:MAG TPA: hypothetical protein VFB14_23875 [Bryobacteraceae bacterium]|jgi:hypothetical protein|nr:hypothetical protein [Bryobacteraceae bacterium]